MANEKTPVVWDDTTKKHRPLGTGEKMGGLDASSIISSDSGNLIQTGSDGLALVTGSSLADPRADNLLETSGNGKLQVTVDRIVEWLDGHPQDAALIADAINVVSGDANNVIVEGSDKGAYLSKSAIATAVQGMTDADKNRLADAIAARIAADIADGKTIVASNGKLTSDPTNATAAQKKAINQALADASSGLVVDNSTGKLKVDFSQMPTDKFEELLRGLKMQIPLAANLSLYVDKNSSAAGDTIIDGRGTQAKPFKTIQACITYATQTYAVGRFNIVIHVAKATYMESLTLPDFTRTSGTITIRAADYADPPTITNSVELNGVVTATAGSWILNRINVFGEFSSNGDALNHFPCCVAVNGGSANVRLNGCTISGRFSGPAASGYVEIRMLAAFNGGELALGMMEGYHISIVATKGNAGTLHVLHSERSSRISLLSSSLNLSSSDYTIACSGACTAFAYSTTSSLIYVVSGSLHLPQFSGTVTGKKYSVVAGSGISMMGIGEFPGDVAGTVEDATYCWYKA